MWEAKNVRNKEWETDRLNEVSKNVDRSEGFILAKLDILEPEYSFMLRKWDFFWLAKLPNFHIVDTHVFSIEGQQWCHPMWRWLFSHFPPYREVDNFNICGFLD